VDAVVAAPVAGRPTPRTRLDAWQVSVVVLLVLLAVAVTGWVLTAERSGSSDRTVVAQQVASGPLTSQVVDASRLLTNDLGAYLAVRPPVVVAPASERRFVEQDQGHVSQIWNKFRQWNFWYSAAVARHYTQFDSDAEISYRYALATWIADQSSRLGDRYHCFESVPYNGGLSKVIPCWSSELRANSAQWGQDQRALAAAWAKLSAAERANLPAVPGAS